ncbi:hypothetical protein [Foetidibacter luteolus]|uniref:hypothetical protein n=1 Tax=Foetidibacter luteolus TaxID=2608880 RepID=UPI00129B401E|nr:hypothetical protein [Foetidibacter luteolus]
MNKIERIQDMLKANGKDNFLRHALALEYIKEGNDAEARRLFEEILTDSPEYTGSYYHLGKLLQRGGEKQLALNWFEKGLSAAKLAKDQHAYNELQAAYEDLADE